MSHATDTNSSNPHGTLFDLLKQRLENHNKINAKASVNENDVNDVDAIKQLSNQFESLHRKRRKLSHGDLAPTPSNSPAIHQLYDKNQNQPCVSHNTGTSHSYSHQAINKRLHDIVSPLRLALASRKIKTISKLTNTPPVTPDSHNNTPVTVAIKSRFSGSPLIRTTSDSLSSSSSLLISPNTRAMVITPSGSLPDMKIDSNENMHIVNNKNKRLRSLSCSEASIVRKSKIMSPRLSAVPQPPILKPIADGLRRYSFDDPITLILPESPRSPKFQCRKTSVISPKCDDKVQDKNDTFLVSSFDEKLDLYCHTDIVKDD